MVSCELNNIIIVCKYVLLLGVNGEATLFLSRCQKFLEQIFLKLTMTLRVYRDCSYCREKKDRSSGKTHPHRPIWTTVTVNLTKSYRGRRVDSIVFKQQATISVCLFLCPAFYITTLLLTT